MADKPAFLEWLSGSWWWIVAVLLIFFIFYGGDSFTKQD